MIILAPNAGGVGPSESAANEDEGEDEDFDAFPAPNVLRADFLRNRRRALLPDSDDAELIQPGTQPGKEGADESSVANGESAYAEDSVLSAEKLSVDTNREFLRTIFRAWCKVSHAKEKLELNARAQSGSGEALYALAAACETGTLGFRKDVGMAIDFYERAVAAGSAQAQVCLSWEPEHPNITTP